MVASDGGAGTTTVITGTPSSFSGGGGGAGPPSVQPKNGATGGSGRLSFVTQQQMQVHQLVVEMLF